MDYFTFIILILLIISIANNWLMYNKSYFYSNKLESDINIVPHVGVITPKIYYSKQSFTENQIKQKFNTITNELNKIDGTYVVYNPITEADYLNINAMASKCSKHINDIPNVSNVSGEEVVSLIKSELLSKSES
jgi:hypothetical protein